MSTSEPLLHEANAPSIQTRWPTPLSARDWDRRFPGLLDGVTIMAGAANVIMQLARLPIGRGVAESRVPSGNIFKHPFKRTRTTITYLAVALMGTSEEKLAYRQAVNRAHAQVRATAPVQYNAFDPELQLWVAACIYWGYADMNRRLRGPLSPEQAAELYRLLEPIGTTLQVRPGMWPADLDAFEDYFRQGISKIEFDDVTRTHLTALVDLKMLHPPLRQLLGPLNRLLTTGFLPPEFRAGMQLDWSPEQQQKFDRILALVAAFNRHLPRTVRQLPFLLVLWDFRRRLRKGEALI